jgi:hypothetical protein
MDQSEESPNKIMRFCNLVDKSKELLAQLKVATSAKEIIEIAASNRYGISYKELRFWSKELKASFSPWSERGNEWRRNFF